MKNKKGLSIIVLVIFSFVIVTILVTIGMNILKLTVKEPTVNEQNGLAKVDVEPIMNFSAWFTVSDGKGNIKIDDKSNEIVMFTCLKAEDGVTPNVGVATWLYTSEFEITESGEYFVYGRDINGKISEPLVIEAKI